MVSMVILGEYIMGSNDEFWIVLQQQFATADGRIFTYRSCSIFHGYVRQRMHAARFL
jgi:hypothetical protein